MPVQISISGADAGEAVKELNALSAHLVSGPISGEPGRAEVTTVAPAVPQQYASPAPVTYPAPQAAPVATVPIAPPAAAPVAPPQVVPQQPATGSVPTAPPETYSIDQLAVAATQLMDAGHDIRPLLAQFQIPALTALPKEQYGNFATALRGMGARI